LVSESKEANISDNMEILRIPDDVAADIKEVDDDIVTKALVCETTKKPFLVIKSELDFYRKMKLPIPIEHPWQRMQERTRLEHSIWLYSFICPQCRQKLYTVYTPEEQDNIDILCESCYLRKLA